MPLLFDPPDDPRDTRDWTREVEEIVAGLVVDVLTAMVTQATDDYIVTFGPALTAAGDLSAFDGIPGQWQTFVVEEFADTIGGIYLNGALTAFVQAEGTVALTEAAVAGWTAVVNQDAVAYSQVLQNRMRDVGDRLWLDLRETVTRGITEGMSIDNLSTELQKVSNFGRYRAEMIARTEVHASMNAGKIEGDLALGEYGPVEKVWLSGRDARVRETHVSADGQYVPITEPFTVGGAALMFPGDPAGPAREVINCRCTYLRLWPGDERPDGSIVPERAEQAVAPEIEPEVAPTLEATRRVRRTAEEIERDRLAEAAEFADEYEVTPQEIVMHLDDAAALQQKARAEAAERAVEVFGQLDQPNFGSLAIPDPRKADRASRVYYDWFDNLHPQEKVRLRQNGWISDATSGIDEMDEAYQSLFGLESTGLPGQALEEHWLRLTREFDLLKQASRGRTPQNYNRYGGSPDYNQLLPRLNADGFDANVVLRSSQMETAAMIARRNIVQASDEAAALLREADMAVNGPPPWRMSFQAWEEEVRELEYLRRESLPMTREQIERYDELAPPRIDSGQDYEELYATIIETARHARFDVADFARIPWR